MKVTVTLTRDVERCCDCPYFDRHPQEPTCDKISEINPSNPWAGFISWGIAETTVYSECPFLTNNIVRDE